MSTLAQISIFCYLLLLACIAHSQSDFSFQNQEIPAGTKAHFTIPIIDGKDTTFIPISVFHGKQEGPVLGITAGVHGYEYPPIMAGQVLISQINPANLKGTVILVQVANVAGFLGRSPYLNPVDGKNLNRAFPGEKEGTITEKIAHFITHHVISRSDFFLDMHGGDSPEDLMSYSAYYHHDNKPEISNQGKAMALSLEFDHIVVFNTTEKDYVKEEYPSLYCSAEAFKRGIPSIDIECGKLGKAEPLLIQQVSKSVMNLLKHLEMYKGVSNLQPTAIIIHDRFYLSSEFDGIFYTQKSSGEYVSKGMDIGYITNFFGETIATLKAPADGILLIILGTPPVNKGETIAVIGRVQ